MSSRIHAAVAVAGALIVSSCPAEKRVEPKLEYALAIHGGAGTVPRDMDPALVAQYEASLTRALALGRDRLAAGGAAVDVVEEVVRTLEEEPLFNAGKGAVLTYDGTHELDASIMDGRTLACGAVAGVKTVRNPIALARLVMDKTRHVLLVGDGAEQFAQEMGVERVENAWFDTERRRKQWEEARAKLDAPKGASDAGVADGADGADGGVKGTVGCVALDKHGHLAAATSTGGLTLKRWGRVGDSPIIGAGTYANDATVAVSCTGTGEEFIRHGVARSVSTRVELAHDDVGAAARAALAPLKKGDGGLIAVDSKGRVALEYNTDGMYRGAADSSGMFTVKIWE